MVEAKVLGLRGLWGSNRPLLPG